MARVHDNREQSSWLDPIKGLVYCVHRGARLRDALFVVTGQPAEVEHHRTEISTEVRRERLSEFLMPTVCYLAPVHDTRSTETILRRKHGCGLNIEGVDSAFGADKVGQKQRVVSVASGGINHAVAKLDPVLEEPVRPFDGGGESVRIRNHEGHHSCVTVGISASK